MSDLESQEFQNALMEIEQRLNQRNIPDLLDIAKIIGYGEISSVLRLDKFPKWVIKRLAIFDTHEEAKAYQHHFYQYNQALKSAGCYIAEGRDFVIKTNERVCFYVVQPAFSHNQLAVNRLRNSTQSERINLFDRVLCETDKVFSYNHNQAQNSTQLSIDGQLSNWAITNEDQIALLDNSTPLMRQNGIELLNYELLLKSTPRFLRGILRAFFLQDVLDRYYDRELVYIDLIANLYKEQLESFIPHAIEIASRRLNKSISQAKIEKYYKEDKLIWRLFLAFRKIDRWVQINVYRNPYQFLLPDKVHR